MDGAEGGGQEGWQDQGSEFHVAGAGGLAGVLRLTTSRLSCLCWGVRQGTAPSRSECNPNINANENG